MPDEGKLNQPWLVAVWPGMGQVAVSAGYYLMAKLGMDLLAELPGQGLFDVEHVEVHEGIIRAARMPRSRTFLWKDPRGRRDLVVFIGEAQPPMGKYLFCRQLIDYARGLGVARIFTFAAMATQMHPSHEARVFAAATEPDALDELKEAGLEVLEDGQIGGLNGVLLGAAAEADISGSCLLGEMPHIFAQLTFPKASLAVLSAFTKIANIKIDMSELTEHAAEMEQRLGQLLSQMEHALGQQRADDDDAPQEAPEESALSAGDRRRIEELFDKAKRDRSVAYELKRELDRLGVYAENEDRFLDLFKKSS
jgi:proteasome assembly chaperone (PAC2) family protein